MLIAFKSPQSGQQAAACLQAFVKVGRLVIEGSSIISPSQTRLKGLAGSLGILEHLEALELSSRYEVRE